MEKVVVELPIESVMPNRFQPRLKFNDSKLNELADSIAEHGVFQPILVRPIGDKYEIILGERRYKASVIAGKKTIPAQIVQMDDKTSSQIALIENVQREDLTPIEEALSYKRVLEVGSLTQQQLANKIGKSQPYIANKLRLLELEEEVQDALLENKISERHARSLLRLLNRYEQVEMLNKIIKERLTVRKTDEEIAKILEDENDLEIVDIFSKPKEDKMNNNYVDPFADINNMASTPQPVENQPTEQIPIFDPFTNNQPQTNQNVAPVVEDIPNEVSSPQIDLNKILNNPVPDMEIPTEPIIEEKTFDDVTPPEDINPGFMDVDKIQNQASDIYVEKPSADLDKILAPTDFKIDHTEDETKQEEPIYNGKFFNFGTDDETTQTEVQPEQKKEDFFNNFDVVEPPKPAEQIKSIDELETETFDSANYNNFAFKPTDEIEITVPKEEKVVPSQAPLSEVINIIRECSDKISSLGYKIDLEEFDFDDMYQAIFKINKK